VRQQYGGGYGGGRAGGQYGGHQGIAIKNGGVSIMHIVIALILCLVFLIGGLVGGFFLGNKPGGKDAFAGQPLQAPVNVRIEGDGLDAVLKWNAVVGARGYRVLVDNKGYDTSAAQLQFALRTAQDQLQSGQTYTLRVRALGQQGESQDSGMSESVVWNDLDTGNQKPPLQTPSLSLSGTVLSWTTVPNSTGYTLKQDGVESTLDSTTTQKDLSNLPYGSYTFAVRANADGVDYDNSQWSNNVTYVYDNPTAQKLPTPTNVRVVGTTLQWDTVAAASGYVVEISGASTSTQNTSSNLYSLQSLTAVGTYTLKVKAKGDGANYNDSDLSASVQYIVEDTTPDGGKLSTPSISVISKHLVWGKIAGASGFVVDIDGTQTSISDGTATTYDLSGLTESKTYVIKLQAKGDGDKWDDSDWSNTATYLPQEDVDISDPEATPDAVQDRIEAILPKADFEALFPYRWGTDGWKAQNDVHYTQQERDTAIDYYSYDNLIEAARRMANIVFVMEWRQEEYGDHPLVFYCPRTSYIDKATGKLTILNTASDFDGGGMPPNRFLPSILIMGDFCWMVRPTTTQESWRACLPMQATRTVADFGAWSHSVMDCIGTKKLI